jgi:hypothetical protein
MAYQRLSFVYSADDEFDGLFARGMPRKLKAAVLYEGSWFELNSLAA